LFFCPRQYHHCCKSILTPLTASPNVVEYSAPIITFPRKMPEM